ncbi:hypothetical protein Nepgr_015096 [Nepenthes gracilis]|uniref:Clp R domain-containing protein n=1 Tax=Nepenthes gracilis TaxID=150966 RepID=A0AAD3SM76_NEPGR|nr:hypothetical protein Nepgr_015096 [Nepenthes gracilis]
MRAGGCSVQQSLTVESSIIVKQAIGLARRRGNAQVTPIHVATVMLASPAGLLKTACLKSHSHPLQCKALELCFNVALNRLPTATPSPILGPHSHYPSLSNALVAAFKRAQAHQRRGSIENQQQPILALKIETEQLVISILDDPSVSRVMREAGFSSPQVKANVEKSVSMEVCSQSTHPINSHTEDCCISPPFPMSQIDSTFIKPLSHVRNEDVVALIDSLVSKRQKKNTVVVGECLADCEGVVTAMKDRIERGGVPLDLKYVQFLSLPIVSMKNLSREEVDSKLGELRCLLKSSVDRGAVFYLGDLRWVSEYLAYDADYQRGRYYCPVEHMIMGLRRLAFGNGESGRLWLLGIANFNSYIKCKTQNPSLETLLDLHPLTIPVGSLVLSLNLGSSLQAKNTTTVTGDLCSWPLLENRINMDVRNNGSYVTASTNSSLPSWLQKCKEESPEQSTGVQQECARIKELCKKWNSFCSSTHKTNRFAEKTLNFSLSSSPSSSTSISSHDKLNPNYLHDTKLSWPAVFESTWPSENGGVVNEPKPDLLSNPNSTPNSASSSEATEALEKPAKVTSFTELNPENLRAVCSALEKKVPWQKDIIPDIASTVLKCREEKRETWMFFLGFDHEGKLKIARELANLVYGSKSSFTSISCSSFSSTAKAADSTDAPRNKRARNESGQCYLETFAEAVQDNPHRVFYVEDVDQADHCTQKGMKRSIESGRITLANGETVPLKDAIVIFISSTSRACSPPIKQKLEQENEVAENKDDESQNSSFSSPNLDLNVAAEDGHGSGERSVSDVGILESVAKKIFFKIPML